LITIHDILPHLNTVEELICGYQLEEYICKSREDKGILPKLKLINGVDIGIVEMEERNKIRDAIEIMQKLPLIANCYVVGQGVGSQAVWYLNDEVGSIIGHSDTPNVRMRSFINSPTSAFNDPNAIGFTVMWPFKEIKNKQAFLRDYLQGFTD